jgi:transcriptional regulator with XRE-family HTH domain
VRTVGLSVEEKDVRDSLLNLRLAIELSQTEFAEALGIGRFNLASYETSRASWRNAVITDLRERLSRFLQRRYDKQVLALSEFPIETVQSLDPDINLAGALKSLCEAYRGAMSDLAAHCGVSRQAVSQWADGTTVPSYRNVILSRQFGAAQKGRKTSATP